MIDDMALVQVNVPGMALLKFGDAVITYFPLCIIHRA